MRVEEAEARQRTPTAPAAPLATTPGEQPAPSERLYQDLRGAPGWLLALGLVALFALLFFRILFTENSVIFHDEYVYKASSDWLIDRRLLLARDLVPEMPNKLYLALIGIHSLFDQNAYVVVGLLNVCAYLAAAVPLAWLGWRAGIRRGRLVGAVLVCLLLPFGLYTKVFMTEAWYLAPFLAAQTFLIEGLTRGKRSALVLAGLMLCCLYLIKPLAILVIGTSLGVMALYVLMTGGRARQLGEGALSLLLGFAAVLPLRWILSPPSPVDTPGGVYGPMVLNGLKWVLLMPFEAPSTFLGKLAYVSWGHLMFGGFLYALPIAAAAFLLRPAPAPEERPRLALSLIALVNLAVLALAAILFTISVNEVGRVHMRYYCFAFCLPVMLLFDRSPSQESRTGRTLAAGATVTCVIACALFYRSYDPIIRIALVSDAPDIGIVHLSRLGLVALSFLPLAAAWFLYRGDPRWRALSIAFVVLFSLYDAFIVTRESGTTFNGPYVRGEEAVAVNACIPPAERNDVLVVGRDRSVVSKFLFRYRAAPHVLYSEGDGSLARSEIPAGSKWIVVLGSKAVEAPAERLVALPTVSVYRLTP
jgi:hypothetical protein